MSKPARDEFSFLDFARPKPARALENRRKRESVAKPVPPDLEQRTLVALAIVTVVLFVAVLSWIGGPSLWGGQW